MKRYSSIVVALFMALSAVAQRHPVDPFIGIEGAGAMYEGACVPFGLVHSAPLRIRRGSDVAYGMTTMMLGGTGCHDGGLGTLVIRPDISSTMPWSGSLVIDRQREVARPGYYGAWNREGTLHHEVTATTHCVMHRITTSGSQGRLNICIDPCRGLLPTKAAITGILPTEATGWIETGGFCSAIHSHRMYFVVRWTSRPGSINTWRGTSLHPAMAIDGDSIGTMLSFPITDGNDGIVLHIGVSFVSPENAKLNLDSELSGSSFDDMAGRAADDWEARLGTIDVRGGTRRDSILFYTALYRNFQYPSMFADVDGRYRDMNGAVRTATDYRRRTFYDMWGCVWTTYPLLQLIAPSDSRDIARTSFEHGREHGILTNWEYLGAELYIMGGDPQPQWVLDLYRKGYIPSALGEYYDMLREASMSTGPVRPVQYLYSTYHYVPGDANERGYVPGSVTLTMEYSMADHAMSRIAHELGRTEDEAIFTERASWYRKLYDGSSGYFRPLLKDGTTWYAPFDPFAEEGNDAWVTSGGPGFKEGSASDYLFFPYHDIDGLLSLFGGTQEYVQKLDAYFARKPFSLYNQPLFTHPWMYTFIRGEEWRSHVKVRDILRRDFSLVRSGYPGNDDLGSTSGWVVWSMLGLYPILDGNASYRLGAPVFDTVRIHAPYPDGRPHDVTIIAYGEGDILDRMTVDDGEHDIAAIDHATLMQASVIRMWRRPVRTNLMMRKEQPKNIGIVPNPVDERFLLHLPDQETWAIDIVDVQGRILITSTTTTGASIDAGGLAPGLYVVTARSGSTCLRRTFVKR